MRIDRYDAKDPARWKARSGLPSPSLSRTTARNTSAPSANVPALHRAYYEQQGVKFSPRCHYKFSSRSHTRASVRPFALHRLSFLPSPMTPTTPTTHAIKTSRHNHDSTVRKKHNRQRFLRGTAGLDVYQRLIAYRFEDVPGAGLRGRQDGRSEQTKADHPSKRSDQRS